MTFTLIRTIAMIVTALPVLLGLNTIRRGMVLRRRSADLVRVGRQVSAVVVDNQMESRSEGRMTFRPVVRFQPATGPEVTVVAGEGSERSFLVGSPLQVVYDPADPAKVALAGVRAGRGHVSVGILFVIMGLLAMAGFYAILSHAGPLVSTGDEFPPGW